MGYDNLVISIKSSDVMMCVKAHELIATQTDHPLHVGITESGTIISGNIKSSIGLGLILHQGIGDTIRVSLTGDPLEEIKSAKLILRTLGLRKGGVEVVSCPTCGRTRIDLIGLANQVENMVADIPLDIKAVSYTHLNGGKNMGFFKDFKDDFSQAVNELMPGEDNLESTDKDDDMVVNTLEDEVDVASELSKLDGLLEQVTKQEPALERTQAATVEPQKTREEYTPVSYTHLDVYKRQFLFLLESHAEMFGNLLRTAAQTL